MAALRRDETRPIHTKNLVIPIAYAFEPPRTGEEPFAISRIPDRYAWLAGVRVGFPTFVVLRLISRASRMNSALADRQWPMVSGDTGEMAMDYEWLWVISAVGVLAPVGVAPFALARDACCWWREHRRERREREMAGRRL